MQREGWLLEKEFFGLKEGGKERWLRPVNLDQIWGALAKTCKEDPQTPYHFKIEITKNYAEMENWDELRKQIPYRKGVPKLVVLALDTRNHGLGQWWMTGPLTAVCDSKLRTTLSRVGRKKHVTVHFPLPYWIGFLSPKAIPRKFSSIITPRKTLNTCNRSFPNTVINYIQPRSSHLKSHQPLNLSSLNMLSHANPSTDVPITHMERNFSVECLDEQGWSSPSRVDPG